MQFLKSLFASNRTDRDAHTLYVHLIEQCRKPVFYMPPYSAPDSMEGRFEVIVLHLAILDYFLSGIAGTEALRRSVQELLIKDMDRSLRELGIGDMSIGKQMKKVGAGMLGRLNSYETAILTEDDKKTKELVASIVDRNMEFGPENGSEAFAAYFCKLLRSVGDINKEEWSVNCGIFAESS